MNGKLIVLPMEEKRPSIASKLKNHMESEHSKPPKKTKEPEID